MTIVEAARKLASDSICIDSYTNFDRHKQYWIFSKNTRLFPDGQVTKPLNFPSKKGEFTKWWKKLAPNQKRVLYSSVNKDSDSEQISEKYYDRIKFEYDGWPASYIAIYYGVKGWSCNQFVGEAYFMAGKNLIHNKKYYSAKDIWEAKYSLKKVDKTKVQHGDIAAFGGTHVEIVTKVDGNDFCSIGAGRGGGILFGLIKSGNGVEVCGFEFYNSRYIDSDNIKFRRLE